MQPPLAHVSHVTFPQSSSPILPISRKPPILLYFFFKAPILTSHYVNLFTVLIIYCIPYGKAVKKATLGSMFG